METHPYHRAPALELPSLSLTAQTRPLPPLPPPPTLPLVTPVPLQPALRIHSNLISHVESEHIC